MNSSSIFEIAMNCPQGLNHPLLAEQNAWVDALLEKHCREEEERWSGQDKRERAESDISDYEEEAFTAVKVNLKEELDFEEASILDFDLCKFIDDLLFDDADDVVISEKIDQLLGVDTVNYDREETVEISEKWSRYFEAQDHGDMLDLLESGLYKPLIFID
jgi:hypothetical protein